MIEYWLELSAREAENDGKHYTDERISAQALMTELWLLFTEYVDSKDQIGNTILYMLKRGVREQTKSIKITSAGYMFRLLDAFGETKN